MLGLANSYKARPSTIFGIEDIYTAYCFDEACAYITRKIADGEEPQFRKSYKSFKDMYAKYR